MSTTAEPQVIKIADIMHQGVTYNFRIKLIPVGQLPPPPPAEQTIDPLKIVKIVTSDDEGNNKGSNMLTENFDHWSCKGNKCTATFDLGGLQQVGEVFIRFPKDAERTAAFEISLSDDGTNWLAKLTGEQQDQGGAVLLINPFFDAKYVRIVGQKALNSIEFVNISGKKMTEPVEPKPEPEIKPIAAAAPQTQAQAISDTEQVAEQATNHKNRKDAKETLKKSKKN